MHLIQILLPLRDPQGHSFPRSALEAETRDLTARFGGVTAYLRSPASGAWQQDGSVEQDDVVMIEVMTPDLDESWWRAYRGDLETRFRQDTVLMRAIEVRSL